MKPSFPRRREDSWECGSLLDEARPVRSVSAGGGLVIAGGDAIHVLRPGTVRPGWRNLPPGQEARLVAVEPWSPRRYAYAAAGHVYVFDGRSPDTEVLTLTFKTPEAEPTHLAWARQDGETLLYLRAHSGKIVRVRPDTNALEEIDAPPMAAIASDATGTLAALCLEDDELAIWVSNETGFETRGINMVPVDDPDVYLAVSGRAVAYSAGAVGTYVSWAEPDDLALCDGLMFGPVAFHGDDALCCAYSVETKAAVDRITRQGEVTRLFEVETEWAPDAELTITSLAWDESRRTLWAASPQVGWILAKEPTAKGHKGVLVS